MRRVLWPTSGILSLLIVAAAAIGLYTMAPNKAGWQAERRGPATAAITAAPPAARPVPQAAAPSPPSFDVVTVDRQGQAVIAGRAMPGDRVQVLEDGKPIGEVTADARGEWVLVPKAPIAPGNRQLSLEATGPDGGPARRSNDVVALSVMPSGKTGHSESTLAVLLPGKADHPVRILQQPEASSPGRALSLDTAEYGEPDRLVLSGHADPGARVSVYAGDRLVGTATADASGQWSLSAPHQHLAGRIELRLDELAGDGTLAHRLTAPFEPSAATAAAAGGTYVVRRGNSLWRIARQVYGEGVRYTAIYAANRERIHDPDLIYPGQEFSLPKH